MTDSKVMNKQADGVTDSLREANRQLNAAKSQTPVGIRDLFCSKIRYQGGEYVWTWYLK